MKKEITVCDTEGCNSLAQYKCVICGKDICSPHSTQMRRVAICTNHKISIEEAILSTPEWKQFLDDEDALIIKLVKKFINKDEGREETKEP